MSRIVFSLASLCVLASFSPAWTDEASPKEPAAKKYHVYTFGCRLGVRLILATDDLKDASTVAAETRNQTQNVRIVTGPHDKASVGFTTPARFEVYRIGIRCGNISSVGVTRQEAEAEKLAKATTVGTQSFVVVSY